MPCRVSRIISFSLICCESSGILVLEDELRIALLVVFLVAIRPPTVSDVTVGGIPLSATHIRQYSTNLALAWYS